MLGTGDLMKSMVTLPGTNIALQNPPFWWYLPGKIGIFYGYVSLLDGTPLKINMRELENLRESPAKCLKKRYTTENENFEPKNGGFEDDLPYQLFFL